VPRHEPTDERSAAVAITTATLGSLIWSSLGGLIAPMVAARRHTG
jgi:hypothetical protein